MSKEHGLSKPKHYKPEPGDEFVKLRDLTPEHKGRIFEARNQRNGEGIRGKLSEANHYLMDGVVGIRFEGETLGLFDVPDALILLKSPDFVEPQSQDSGGAS